MSQSQWYVVTGAPSSGKTTIIEQLAQLGYKTIPEAARMIIDEGIAQGKTLEEIRIDEASFQQCVIDRNLEMEDSLPIDEVIFLDRAVPDSLAYYKLIGQDMGNAMVFPKRNFYRRIFCLEPLVFVKDYARIESAETMMQLHNFFQEVYLYLGYEVILVPPIPTEDRVHFILDRM
jgi:predicted ATPase